MLHNSESTSVPIRTSRQTSSWIAGQALCIGLAAALSISLQTSTSFASPQATVQSEHQPPTHPTSVEGPIYSHLRLADPQSTNPQSPERLLLAFADQHTAGNYAGAELLAGDLIASIPNHPQGYYNLACSLARQRKIDSALVALNAAVDRGWRRINHTQVDPDLEPLRGYQEFDALLERMRSLQAAEAVEPKPLRLEPAATIASELSRSVPKLLQRYHVPGVIVVYIEEGTPAWVNAFGSATTDSVDLPMDASCRVVLQRPVELLALLAAAQESSRKNLNLARLFGEADRVGLRGSPSTGSATRLADAPVPSQRGTRLTTLASPIDRTVNSAGGPAVDWTGTQSIVGTVELLTLSIELITEQSFDDYCASTIFNSAGLSNTRLSSNKKTHHGRQATSTPHSAPQLIGHTRFGTPIAGDVGHSDPSLETTVDDLARLLCATMQDDSPISSAHVHDAIRQASASPLGLGLSIDRPRSGVSDVGRGLQIAELHRGTGILARWFPDAGRGVIVVFNSENGPEVAMRIVNEALGGQ